MRTGRKRKKEADSGIYLRNLPFLEISMQRQGEVDAGQEKILWGKDRETDVRQIGIY